MTVRSWAAAAAVLGLAGSAAASSGPPPCRAPEYRQFDFWVGDWDVFDPSGTLVGTNSITREYDGCVLQEHWEARGPRKQTGSSFNTYHAAAGRWHQTWVDSTGGFLLLDGGLAGESMVLEGEMLGRRGRLHHRIRFTPRPDGQVRQFWETSADGGKTWNVAFDGTYVRRKK
ncbi:MAG TPA: hypothetical protein VMR21_15150 [Vicinamibacteria bacterium]|nr:hypothetical protein [Vicinamibacteria bacterium]